METDPSLLPSVPLVLEAACFAAQRHAQQRRKGMDHEPYINHLLEVASLLAQSSDPLDVNLVVAGLLHDIVEDTHTTREEVAARFGEDVAGLVMEVTDDKTLPKQVRKDLQVQRAPHKSPRAQKLKAADKISNLRSLIISPPADWSPERRVEYVAWARRVIDGCGSLDGFLKDEFYRTHAQVAGHLC
ncbi:MAG: HD domain-containing protein [Proteobacteria bacterium]|nr:HD domain-containing protein [Pseudomonadota bacterium]